LILFKVKSNQILESALPIAYCQLPEASCQKPDANYKPKIIQIFADINLLLREFFD
jgi:hypothetical protein